MGLNGDKLMHDVHVGAVSAVDMRVVRETCIRAVRYLIPNLLNISISFHALKNLV
jgi:hypothetical protein